ncbi:hypothetical protein LLS1_10990 [Leifsonia sp. LS1]|uniref:PucR family transcriptional regulator n=1 Tax=Leifsonia sp. LS1 TaxID=2828483 RepID=UPI001CFC98B8|nr:helix-turn-helix domain-containing protein [Leifsonia sp. LS1]GIT79430.1 hypothetical protein LLS1_10990 [Leifsonia sp. LS1]
MNLQDVVDQLAMNLARSVVIDDLRYRPLVSSAQGDEIDELRASALLKRSTPEPVRAYLDELGVGDALRPVTVDLTRFGGKERLAVPVRDEGGPIAVLWLITGNLPPLRACDYAAIDSAVDLARAALNAGHRSEDCENRRAGVLRRLLDPDPATRSRALRDAGAAHLLPPRGGATLLAVRLDSGAQELERATFAKYGSSPRTTPLDLIGDQDGDLVFLTRGSPEDALPTLQERAEHLGLPILAIGSAQTTGAEDDLLPVAKDARTAVSIVAAVTSLGGYADIRGLGTWRLLSEITAGEAHLARYSPAAHALLVHSDPVHRETVETYLDAGGNVRAACERLHLHRTTLYYRLDNLPQVVREALDDGISRSALHLCLKLARFA